MRWALCAFLLSRHKSAALLSGLSWGLGRCLELSWETAVSSAFPFVPRVGQDSGDSAGAAGLCSAACAGLVLLPANPWGEPGGGVAHGAQRQFFCCVKIFNPLQETAP